MMWRTSKIAIFSCFFLLFVSWSDGVAYKPRRMPDMDQIDTGAGIIETISDNIDGLNAVHEEQEVDSNDDSHRHNSHSHHHHHNRQCQRNRRLEERYQELANVVDRMRDRCYTNLNGTTPIAVNDTYYAVVVDADMTWYEAMMACMARGMVLATISSAAEQSAVMAFLTAQGAFSDPNNIVWFAPNSLSGSWLNFGNTYNPLLNYNNWAGGTVPAADLCGGINNAGLWNGFACDGSGGENDIALCEVPRPCSGLL